jgi:hypothetical protein
MNNPNKIRSTEELDKAMDVMHEVLKKAMPNSNPNFKGLIGELGDSNSSAVFLGIKNSLSQPTQ